MTAAQAKRIAVILRDLAQSLPYLTTSLSLRSECYVLAVVMDREAEEARWIEKQRQDDRA